MRILIVEDEKGLADIIEARLKKEKYSVDVSYNGEDGLDNALTNIYDLIILDVMLPRINGFEILKEIKNNKIESKIIMLTAKSELEDKLNGFERGANDYITKPFHIDIILKEFLLLEYFMRNPNQILSREQIFDKVWGMDNESESNNVEAYVSFVRKKLKAIGSNITIKTARGMGYKMEV